MRTMKDVKRKQAQARANARRAVDKYPHRIQPQSIIDLVDLAVLCASRSW